jgi:ATP synthase protein I
MCYYPPMSEEIPAPPPAKNSQRDSSSWSLAYGGTQLAAAVLAGLGVGYFLDKKFGCAPWLMLAGALVGILAGLYSFLKPFLSNDKK